MESINEKENDIEEILEPQSHGGALQRNIKAPDATGVAYYGKKFTRYMKVAEYQDIIPAFKELYYQRMIAEPTAKLTHILREFNDMIESQGRVFWPHTTQARNWKKKWDKDILEKKGMMMEVITTKKNVQQVLKTREDGESPIVKYGAPAYEELEQGLQTLGGELMNDAMQMLRDDQALEDIYESDELIKRKMYVTNVFAHVTKMVHGKASLMLKASQEKRENAGFLMELMKKATSGKMSVAEVAALRTTYQQPTEQPNVI